MLPGLCSVFQAEDLLDRKWSCQCWLHISWILVLDQILFKHFALFTVAPDCAAGAGVDEQLDSCPSGPTCLMSPVSTGKLTGGSAVCLRRERWRVSSSSVSGSSSGNRAGGFSCALACTWSGGCIYSSVFLSCVDTGEDQ